MLYRPSSLARMSLTGGVFRLRVIVDPTAGSESGAAEQRSGEAVLRKLYPHYGKKESSQVLYGPGRMEGTGCSVGRK